MDDRPDALLSRSVRVLQIFVEYLRRLRATCDSAGDQFKSVGFRTLFDSLAAEVGDEYLAGVERHLRRLDRNEGVLMSARLGDGNVGTGYVLRRPHRLRLRERILGDRTGYEFSIDPRDEGGTQALGELRARGIALAAVALGRSADHIKSFFEMLRFELGFYLACLNLHDLLDRQGQSRCFPDPIGAGVTDLTARGLYDPCLCIAGVAPVVASDVDLAGKSLLVITGANRGGKSTFLRALGLAQLMMQSGMFVAADAFRANLVTGVFTHYRREEDATMTRGKFDEELSRASAVVDSVGPGALVLFNESFASTNEREGAEIAGQLVHALLDSGVKVAYVTHMYELAHSLWAEGRADAEFLRAERLPDGRRTFRLVEGEPLPTSHGVDLYRRIFDAEEVAEAAAPGL
jgi:DNA mismatch repair ATPase MutS